MKMMSKEEIMKSVERLGPWGQRISLPYNVYTGGVLDIEHRWDFIKRYLPKELKDMRVLDIGCSAGFFSINIKTRLTV